MPDFTLRTVDQLRSLYHQPGKLVRAKVRPELDPASRAFIERAPFVLLATVAADGGVDVSPRGGPPGFVRVLDEGQVAIPDLNGNNLLYSLENVVATGQVGLLFVLPGQDETLRVNGHAAVSTDPELLDGFTAELRRPKTAVVVDVDEVFIHCAKAFRRGEVWDPDSWDRHRAGPDAVAILACQLGLDDGDSLRAGLERGYTRELALDRPGVDENQP